MSGKTQKKLRVVAIKQLEPKADVYELHPYCKYIVMVRKSNIITQENEERMAKGKEIIRIMAALGIPAAVFVGSLDDVQIIELQAEKI